ncbi:MAG TPA: DUF2604 domain-containing protein [Candidatus Eisenbacteria bacterium]|nr:DUF2604 domain-containing protein [Candidatus Eisenbacteria bacterium]
MPTNISLTIIVNGVQAIVLANPEAPLAVVVPKALEETRNSGRPLEDWQLKDASGNPLDTSKKVEDFNFPPGTKLYLSLRAGGGGG